MAEIQPFRGLRYDVAQVGDLSDVTCPPYDVIDEAFQEALYQRHPCNVIRMELNRTEPGDATSDERYRRASGFLRRWTQEGVLMREPEEAIYVYHQQFRWEGRDFTRKGFMARIRLERFGEGKVFPHEQTLSGPKADRLLLLQATQTNLSPIFGLFPDDDLAAQTPLEDHVIGKTPLEATDHLGVLHRLWPVSKAEVVNKVKEVLRDKPVFIADGHHRYETAINYRDGLVAAGTNIGPDHPANFVMMMFVGMSDPGLVILPTHRLLTGLGSLRAADVEGALSSHFTLQAMGTGDAAAKRTWEEIELDGSQTAFGFGTTADGEWRLARVKDASPMKQLAAQQSDDWRGLGVSLLHKLAVDHLLCAKHPGAPRFTYVHSLAEVAAAQSQKQCDLACLVPAAGIGHVEKIAARLEKMPPKSTYFYPKLLTGLVFNSVG